MIEEIKEILTLVANAGEFTIQAAITIIISFGIYKLLTLASVLLLIKYIVEKIFDYFYARKTKPEELIKWTIRNSSIFIAEEKLMVDIVLLAKQLSESKTSGDLGLFYSHEQNLVIRILTKELEKQRKNKSEGVQ